jgi:adenylate kinase
MARDRTAWLKGGEARCLDGPAATRDPKRLVLLGPPGVGKGTQAELLSGHFGACHLSTGDVFRTVAKLAADQRSPAMEAALQLMRQGGLLSDDMVLGVVRERVRCLKCGGGFLLDGFPRTVEQARALDALLGAEGVELTGAISYDLPVDQLVARLGGRRVCPQCNAVFHRDPHPPRTEGICDQCGGALVQREDDRPAAVEERLRNCRKTLEPVIRHYEEQRILIEVSAQGTVREVFARTLRALSERCSDFNS